MILALETSTGVGGAALLDGSRLIAEQTLAEPAEKRRSQRRHKRHRYTAEQFGLNAASLRAEFEDYESIFLGD